MDLRPWRHIIISDDESVKCSRDHLTYHTCGSQGCNLDFRGAACSCAGCLPWSPPRWLEADPEFRSCRLRVCPGPGIEVSYQMFPLAMNYQCDLLNNSSSVGCMLSTPRPHHRAARRRQPRHRAGARLAGLHGSPISKWLISYA